jgi:hypothetical protein
MSNMLARMTTTGKDVVRCKLDTPLGKSDTSDGSLGRCTLVAGEAV